MKTLIFSLILAMSTFCYADEYILDTPETEISPITVRYDWQNVNIDLANNILTIFYNKLNDTGQAIPKPNGRTRRVWACQNRADDPETPEDETETCWSDVFMFAIRTQDVGTPIGRGLRMLIKNQMSAAGLIGTGSFDD